jgi:hypothetical protein
VICVSLLAAIVGIAFVPPGLLPEGQFRDTLVKVQGYLPYGSHRQVEKEQVAKPLKEPEENTETSPRHSSYSPEDIEKVKQKLLAEKRRKLAQGTEAAKSVLELEAEEPETAQIEEKTHIYLIELYSGGRIYTDSVSSGDGAITYTSESGLVISIASHEIKSVQKLKIRRDPGKQEPGDK